VRVLSVLLAGLNAVLSSGFQLLVVYRLGVGEMSDLYYGATIAVIVIFTIYLDPLSNVLIPMFVEKEADGNNEKVELFWNSMFVVFLFGAAIVLVTYFPMRLALPLIYKSLRWVNHGEVGKIVALYSIYLILFGAITVKNCYLFACGRPVAAQSNMLVSCITSVLLISRLDVATDVSRIAYCLIGGGVAGLAFPNLDRSTFFFRGTHFRAHLSALIRRGWLLTSGSAIFKAESLLDGAIASFFGAGSLTVYQLFSRMLLSVSTIINSGYIQPVTKHLAEAAKHEQWSSLRGQARKSAFWASAAAIACLIPLVAILLILNARPIHALDIFVQLFGRNQGVFLLMLGYLVGSLIWKVYATGLIVLNRERLFALLCISTFLVGVVLKILGAYSAGLAGLALGTSLYWILGAACMAAGFWRSLRVRQDPSWARSPELPSEIVPKFGSAD
jgi:peptidoglycan biosynthesis protein MviN/MurJ (putative lipid II flippase)